MHVSSSRKLNWCLLFSSPPVEEKCIDCTWHILQSGIFHTFPLPEKHLCDSLAVGFHTALTEGFVFTVSFCEAIPDCFLKKMWTASSSMHPLNKTSYFHSLFCLPPEHLKYRDMLFVLTICLISAYPICTQRLFVGFAYSPLYISSQVPNTI